MSFDSTSYIMGHSKGLHDGEGLVVIQSGITCTDDGAGNVTIEEEQEEEDE